MASENTLKHITEKDMDYKTESDYLVKLLKVEVRKAEIVDRSFETVDKKTGEKKLVETSFIQVTFLDDEHDIIGYLQDKDLTRAPLYKRGVIGDFLLSVSVDLGYKGRTKIYVADFQPEKEE